MQNGEGYTFVLTFAAGAGGMLSIGKLLQIMKRKRSDEEGVRIRKLFPNGERDEIIQAIDELKLNRRQDRKDLMEMKLWIVRIAEHLQIEL